jgi:hypothetical protein
VTSILAPIAGLIGVSSPLTLAFRPFLEPLPIDRYWMLLLLPLVMGIAVVYKTIKTDRLEKIPREATVLAAQIVAFMVMAAGALWLLTELA